MNILFWLKQQFVLSTLMPGALKLPASKEPQPPSPKLKTLGWRTERHHHRARLRPLDVPVNVRVATIEPKGKSYAPNGDRECARRRRQAGSARP